MTRTLTRKARAFWPLFLVLLLADCTTKAAAVASLQNVGEQKEVVGDVVRFTLAYNDRGAMGISFGDHTMLVLGILGFGAALLLHSWYRSTPSGALMLPAALALIIAGALGNAWERVFSPHGVVDFIDIGIGASRFYTFNVADIGITLGTVLLALAIVTEERAEATRS